MMGDSQSSAKQRIRNEAWRQFRDAGYTATTYASIAKACGVGRSLVQYHFPRKEELPISLVSWVLEKSSEALGADAEGAAGDHVVFHRVGSCTFTFLLEGGFSRFMLEALESRAITEALLAMNVEWTVGHLGGEAGSEGLDIARTVIMDMGGFYDYLYHCLANGEDFDVAGCLAMSVCASAKTLSPGKGYELGDFDLDEAAESDIRKAVRKVSSVFEQTLQADG